MDSLLLNKLRAGRGGKPPHEVTAVAAYEDSATDMRVNEFCRDLAGSLGRECQMNRQMWMLSELRVPQLRAIAAQEAAGADLIIIAVHHAEALPTEMKSWIELWAGHKGKRPLVLMALFDPIYRGVSASMRAYLADVARQTGMAFMVESEDRPEED